MALTDYMTLDEPRAVLGVSDEELENVTLDLPIYSLQLDMELEAVYSGLGQLYADTKALAVKTAAQQKLLNVTAVYATYAISKILLTSASLFAPKRIGDGRAETERVNDPFQDVRDGVDSALITLRARLVGALVGLGLAAATPSVGRNYFLAAGLAINPVTNS